jgi:thioredoxin reductase (NADPH)
MHFEVAIIGCGPAGLSAAVYTGRAGLKTVVFGDHTKSSLYKAHLIANYLGFPEPVSGPVLAGKAFEHAKKFGAEMVPGEIVHLGVNEDGTFSLKDDKKRQYSAKTVIIATGQSYALSGIKNEKELTGKGVSYCAVCDGFFFRGKNVVVVGSGNYAGEEALQLLSYTKNITVLSHGKDFEFSAEMKKDLEENNITLQKTVRIKEIGGKLKPGPDGTFSENAGVEKLILADGSTVETHGVFMAIGVAGAGAFAKKLGLETANNYIKVDSEGLTSIPGIFAAGDCTGAAAQVATGVGNGCNAALSAIKLLRGARFYTQYN